VRSAGRSPHGAAVQAAHLRGCGDLLLALYFDPVTPSYAQVAERLGRSIGGIGPMRARCLQRMRALLGEDLHP